MTRELISVPIESVEYSNMKLGVLESENRKLNEANTELLEMLEKITDAYVWSDAQFLDHDIIRSSHQLILKTKENN